MKIIVWTKYGLPDVLKIIEIYKPTPKDDEVLIKVCATTVETGDCEMRRFQIPVLYWLFLRVVAGLIKPTRLKILGQQFAGEIEEIGKDVIQFTVGNQVIGPTGMNFGAYAEYLCLPSTSPMAIKPTNMTFEEAAAVTVGGLNALHFLRKGNIQQGQKVLIFGSTGSIGTFAVQLAKVFGAEVTAICSTTNEELVKSLGADKVIDYTKEDFTKNGERYDVIFDTIGKSPYSDSVNSLRNKGRYLLANPSLLQQLRGLWDSMTSNKKIIFSLLKEKSEDLVYLKELIEAGKVKTVIDRCYPLEQTAEAHRYVEEGHKKGNVIITVAHPAAALGDRRP